MKRNLYIILCLISLFMLLICLFFRCTYYSFNSNKVKETATYLSSDDFKGRLPGSLENEQISEEIATTFDNLNLKPLSNNYREQFTVTAPIYNGNNPSLKILDKNNSVIKEFVLGKDFKEDFINFKSNSIQFSKENSVHIYEKSIIICKDNRLYLFYVTFDKNFNFRSSFINDSQFDFAIQITTDTFNSILDSIRNGYMLDVQLPYDLKAVNVYNVCGMIQGTSELPPLIITAHFDHLGYDSLKRTYCGALDNASGTAFMLELCKTFSSLKLPKRDIIFVALNCEEFGLLGSNEFAKEYQDKLQDSTVINFDMIGASDTPITLMSGANSSKTSSTLLNDLTSICIDENLDYKISYEDASDHASFINSGFDSLTICHADTTSIHTPRDTSEKLCASSIDDVYSLIYPQIIDTCYSDKLLILYDRKTLIFFSITTATLGIFLIKMPR